MRSRILVGCVVLLGLAASLRARAEVSAKLDANGQYAGMVIRYNATSRPPRTSFSQAERSGARRWWE